MGNTFTRNKLKYAIDEKFFNKWSSQMAYVLGFTYADGSIYKTSLSWDLQVRDLELLTKFNKVLKSNYPIYQRHSSVRLRISNQKLIEGLKNRGVINNKATRIRLPKIPGSYVRHFVRGFLDGDGWFVKRNGRNEVDLGFVCTNKLFLEDLSNLIFSFTGIRGRVREKHKITPRGVESITFLMEFYSRKAFLVAKWLWGDLKPMDLYLLRKYRRFLKSVVLYKYLDSGTKVARVVQKKFGESIHDLLKDLYFDKHLGGRKIASVLNIHSSSIYRWLEITGLKYVNHKIISNG